MMLGEYNILEKHAKRYTTEAAKPMTKRPRAVGGPHTLQTLSRIRQNGRRKVTTLGIRQALPSSSSSRAQRPRVQLPTLQSRETMRIDAKRISKSNPLADEICIVRTENKPWADLSSNLDTHRQYSICQDFVTAINSNITTTDRRDNLCTHHIEDKQEHIDTNVKLTGTNQNTNSGANEESVSYEDLGRVTSDSQISEPNKRRQQFEQAVQDNLVRRIQQCRATEDSIPTFYTGEMSIADMTRRGSKIVKFASKLGNARGDHPVIYNTICVDDTEILMLPHRFNLIDLPPSSLRITWRVSQHRPSPSFQLVFLLLNRFAHLACVARVSANCVCAVFETIQGAEQAMARLKPCGGPRLLIADWWQAKYSSVQERRDSQSIKALEWVDQNLMDISGGILGSPEQRITSQIFKEKRLSTADSNVEKRRAKNYEYLQQQISDLARPSESAIRLLRVKNPTIQETHEHDEEPNMLDTAMSEGGVDDQRAVKVQEKKPVVLGSRWRRKVLGGAGWEKVIDYARREGNATREEKKHVERNVWSSLLNSIKNKQLQQPKYLQSMNIVIEAPSTLKRNSWTPTGSPTGSPIGSPKGSPMRGRSLDLTDTGVKFW